MMHSQLLQCFNRSLHHESNVTTILLLKNTPNLYNLKLQSFIFSHVSVGLLGWVASYKLDPVLLLVPLSVLEAKGQLGHILFMPVTEV